MKTEDFSWCNDSGYSDVFNNSLCECTAPQVNDGMCICGRPINDNMTNTLKQNLELCKALAEVDRLTSENLDLKQQNHVWESEWQEQREKIDELKYKFRKLKLSIINQIVLFEMGTQSPHESAKLIKQILE